MLRRIESTRNQHGRIWYQGDHIDLMLWLDGEGSINRFDLAQRPPDGEQLLSWRRESGFSWHRIDSGEDRAGHYKAAALLFSDAATPLPHWQQQLLAEAEALPPALLQQLVQLLAEED